MSGAKNCPETPRQKMIGMMYLVLTAMLALNVSSEILNGFTMVDNSLHTTISSSELRNKSLYQDFQDLSAANPEKVREWLDKAKIVKKESEDLYNYIEEFKKGIIKLADKSAANDSAYVNQIIAKDNLDAAGQYAIIKGNGAILESKIGKYRDFLVGLSPDNPSKQAMYRSIFSTSKTKGKSWKTAMFEMMPVSAVITILTKYQSDVRASEAEIVQYLKSQTDAMDFRVNKIDALVVPNTRYVIRGGNYSAQIVLSAIDSTKKPLYYIGGTPINKGFYNVSCGKTGVFNYSGQIKMTGNDGVVKSYPFKGDYIVGEPSATLSNEALNVVYRGIDNILSISVPGVASENVSVAVAGGTAQKIAGGRYNIRPTQDGEIRISVSAKIDGKMLPMGGGTYRVKYLPNPTSYLQYADGSGITRLIQDGTITKRLLKSPSVTLIASYGQDELVKANFTVTSFTMLTIFGSVNVNGSRFNARQLSDIEKLEGGDILTLKNIKAVGPDGKVRSLGMIQVQI